MGRKPAKEMIGKAMSGDRVVERDWKRAAASSTVGGSGETKPKACEWSQRAFIAQSLRGKER